MKILILAPHTDDGELGCGASIAKMVRQGNEVFYVAFSSCEESLPEGFKPGTLKNELMAATSCLGIRADHVQVYDFLVRNFAENRQKILDCMIQISRDIKPELVMMTSEHDVHQDHYTIAKEGLRAFKKNSILAYEVPWNNYSFNNQVFISVEEQDVRKKIEAINCYVSQGQRPYTSEEFLRGVLRMHGVQIGEQYAEVFETPRIVIRSGIKI